MSRQTYRWLCMVLAVALIVVSLHGISQARRLNDVERHRDILLRCALAEPGSDESRGCPGWVPVPRG